MSFYFSLPTWSVMLVLSLVTSLLGVNKFLTANGLNLGMLLVFAAVIGFGGSLISLMMSKMMAKWSTGARVIESPSNSTEVWLVDTVGRLAQRAGLPMPEVAIYDGEPNAFATGASKNSSLVAVSTDLLASMTREEAEAVLAPEVAHIANGVARVGRRDPTSCPPRTPDEAPRSRCIDTSGSMSGAPEAVAKALVLAVARRMARERRPLHLLLFGGPGEGNELEISPGSAGARGLLAFLRMSFNAGTDYDTPLLRALQLLRGETFKQADVLIVTDGLCRASARVAERVAEAKQAAGARVLGVVIGGERAGLETFCDRVWMLDPTSPSTEGIDLRDFAA